MNKQKGFYNGTSQVLEKIYNISGYSIKPKQVRYFLFIWSKRGKIYRGPKREKGYCGATRYRTLLYKNNIKKKKTFKLVQKIDFYLQLVLISKINYNKRGAKWQKRAMVEVVDLL